MTLRPEYRFEPTRPAEGRIYLDCGATTPLAPEVLEAMAPALTGIFGNTGTLCAEGMAARDLVKTARRDISAALGARDPHEVILCSGGTESDNMGVIGIARARRASMSGAKGCGQVICSSFEHKAVLEAASSLKSEGHDVSFLPPDRDGFVSPKALDAMIRPDTLVVSVMLANNEIGTIQPIGELAKVCHTHGVPLHVDAVAGLGKIDAQPAVLGADAVSVCAHKINGPKGAGALWISKRTPFLPIAHGGGQEKGKRSGTHDTASILGFARACSLTCGEGQRDEIMRLTSMRDRLVRLITDMAERGADVRLAVDIPEGDVERHLCCLIPVLVGGWESEELLRRLDSMGFCVSGGSACTASQAATSHVLRSIGVEERYAQGYLRVTLGRYNEMSDVEGFAAALEEILGL